MFMIHALFTEKKECSNFRNSGIETKNVLTLHLLIPTLESSRDANRHFMTSLPYEKLRAVANFRAKNENK